MPQSLSSLNETLFLVISSLKLKSTITSNWSRNDVASRIFHNYEKSFQHVPCHPKSDTIFKPNMWKLNLMATESIFCLSSMLRADSPANFCEAGIVKTNGLAPVWNNPPGITACWCVEIFSVCHWAAMESGVSNNTLKVNKKFPWQFLLAWPPYVWFLVSNYKEQ